MFSLISHATKDGEAVVALGRVAQMVKERQGNLGWTWYSFVQVEDFQIHQRRIIGHGYQDPITAAPCYRSGRAGCQYPILGMRGKRDKREEIEGMESR